MCVFDFHSAGGGPAGGGQDPPSSDELLAMAYVDSRAVQQRFDEVCGPADWRNEFREGPGGGVLCGISVRIDREDGTAEWVTKWDGADNSQVEAVKGGL